MKSYISFTILILFQLQLFSQCIEPTEVQIETDYFYIIWTENGSATTWDVEYNYAGFTPSGIPTEEDLTETRFSIYELDTADYDFYVKWQAGE